MQKIKSIRTHLPEFLFIFLALSLFIVTLTTKTIVVSETFHTTLLTSLVTILVLFLIFFWRSPKDEREESHSAYSGKFGYILGSLTLIIAMIVQCYHHTVDPWILIALTVMVVSRMIHLVHARIIG